MARPFKKSLDYFSFDTDFFDSLKIKKLRNKFNSRGIIIYLYLVSYCYKENGYYLIIDEDLEINICDYFRISPDEFKEIFNFILDIGLFEKLDITKNFIVITSERIQKNFQAGVKSRAKKNPVKVNKYIWLVAEDETEEYINISQ